MLYHKSTMAQFNGVEKCIDWVNTDLVCTHLSTIEEVNTSKPHVQIKISMPTILGAPTKFFLRLWAWLYLQMDINWRAQWYVCCRRMVWTFGIEWAERWMLMCGRCETDVSLWLSQAPSTSNWIIPWFVRNVRRCTSLNGNLSQSYVPDGI